MLGEKGKKIMLPSVLSEECLRTIIFSKLGLHTRVYKMIMYIYIYNTILYYIR